MLCYNGAVRRIPTQMCKTQQCAERNNGKKVFLQENGGKENFVGFLKSVEYNNPGREKRKSEKCAQYSNRADGKILPRGNVRRLTTRAEKSLYCAVGNNPGPCRANCAQTNNPRQDAPQKNGFLRIVRRITTALPRKKRIVP